MRPSELTTAKIHYIQMTSIPKGNDRSPENKQVFSNSSQVKDFFSIGQGQPTLQSMVGQNSDVNKDRNSVANLQTNDTLHSQRRSCQR